MKHKFIYTFITTLLILPNLSFAFFCPTNFNQIDFGETPDQVIAQCGKPDKEDKKEVQPNVAQEWSYFVTQTVATQSMDASQGTLKTQMVFDNNGKLINLNVNGIGVGSTAICGNTIQLGDSKDSIKSACGQPTFVTKAEPTDSEAPATKVVEFTYNVDPPVKLTFENGQLKDKE